LTFKILSGSILPVQWTRRASQVVLHIENELDSM
jgi:hypothetical protein